MDSTCWQNIWVGGLPFFRSTHFGPIDNRSWYDRLCGLTTSTTGDMFEGWDTMCCNLLLAPHLRAWLYGEENWRVGRGRRSWQPLGCRLEWFWHRLFALREGARGERGGHYGWCFDRHQVRWRLWRWYWFLRLCRYEVESSNNRPSITSSTYLEKKADTCGDMRVMRKAMHIWNMGGKKGKVPTEMFHLGETQVTWTGCSFIVR